MVPRIRKKITILVCIGLEMSVLCIGLADSKWTLVCDDGATSYCAQKELDDIYTTQLIVIMET
jgi:hypothetical protein